MSAWLEVLGRAHPMVLHLPIGFLVALAVLEFFAPAGERTARRAANWLVGATVVATLAAVGTGLVHAREPSFSGGAFELHRNWGLALGACVLVAAVLHARSGSRTPYRVALVVGLGLLLPTGHFGAELTHGPGFLTEPLRREPSEPAALEPSTYAAVIRPILDANCIACHGTSKQKGGLSLASEERILAGGKHGPVLGRGSADKALLLQRIEFPLDHDKHMPPEDREQLAPEQMAALQQWIAAGAPFEGTVEALGAVVQATPALLAEQRAPSLPPAPAAALDALRAALAHVQPISADSPLLWVDFAACAKGLDDARACELLLPVKVQLAELSLARSAIGDATLDALASFPSLVKLDLRATNVGAPGLAALAAHPALAELVLAQTRLDDSSVDSLIAMPALERVHLWRSGLSAEALARLRDARPTLVIEAGDTPASAALETEGELVFGAASSPAATSTGAAPSLAPINTKCPVTGAPVNQAFRIVHDGRVIGFCCSECPKAFWAEPAKFADALK